MGKFKRMKGFKRLAAVSVSVLIISGIMLTLTACGSQSTFDSETFETNQNTVTATFKFTGNDSSEKVACDGGKISDFQTYVEGLQVEYPYSKLFNYDEAISGIYVDHTVEKHEYSALDANGKLTKEHLLEVVNENTAAYVKEQNTSTIKALDDESLVERICEIIADTVNDMLEKYPDIDKERVYCNLGYLKIVQKSAAITDDTTVNASLKWLDDDKKLMMSAKLEAADTVYKLAP